MTSLPPFGTSIRSARLQSALPAVTCRLVSTIPERAPEKSQVRLCVLQGEPLYAQDFLDAIADPAAGGHDLFIGTVRNQAGGRPVSGLGYSAHPSAAQKMEQAAHDVAARHEVIAIALGHRTGELRVGDAAVVCAVSAAHRDAAFAACRDLIDLLKEQVPIWKHEHFADGESIWVGLPEGDD